MTSAVAGQRPKMAFAKARLLSQQISVILVDIHFFLSLHRKDRFDLTYIDVYLLTPNEVFLHNFVKALLEIHELRRLNKVHFCHLIMIIIFDDEKQA